MQKFEALLRAHGIEPPTPEMLEQQQNIKEHTNKEQFNYNDSPENIQAALKILTNHQPGAPGDYNRTFFILAAFCANQGVSPQQATVLIKHVHDTVWPEENKRTKVSPTLEEKITEAVTNGYEYAKGGVGSRQPTALFAAAGAPVLPAGAVGVRSEPPDESVLRMAQTLEKNEQIEYFKGCSFIESRNKFITPDGVLIVREAFKVKYSGPNFHWKDGADSTNDAVKAYTQSQVHDFPKHTDIIFKPPMAYGETYTDDRGRKYYNTYRAPDIGNTPGYVLPFIQHMHKILPRGEDAEILISYLAAVVQNPGTKFRWWPVLQGGQGVGKSLLANAMSRIVGTEYSHNVRPDKVDTQFNAWQANKIFVVFEELDLQRDKKLVGLMKELVTGERVEIEEKGVDQKTVEQCVNGLICTNQIGAMSQGVDDRRYATLICEQQCKDDLERDGMDEQYFHTLATWFKSKAGIEALAYFLKTYPIKDKHNPLLHSWAPATSRQDEVIEAGLGRYATYIKEAIDDEAPGFKSGYLVSDWCKRYLERMGKKLEVSNREIGEIMKELGYVMHPQLVGDRGRLELDGIRLTVYVHRHSGLLGAHRDHIRNSLKNDPFSPVGKLVQFPPVN